jgi:hypothetical protein
VKPGGARFYPPPGAAPQHEDFAHPYPSFAPVPPELRWQIDYYAAEEARLGPRGWHGRRSGEGCAAPIASE